MADLARLDRAQRAVLDAWWAQMPAGGWTRSRLVWSRVVNAVFQDIALTRPDGGQRLGRVSPELGAALDGYREALADPHGGGWCTALELTLSAEGEMQAHVIWDDQVWFGDFGGAPLEPDPDPTAPEIPTAEMWRRELELHPRAPERVPDWWRMLLAADPAAAMPAEAAPRPIGADTLEEALGAPVRLPATFAVMQDAWGWDRVVDAANDAVVGALRGLDEVEAAALFGDDDEAAGEVRDEVEADAGRRFAERTRGEWLAGTPVRLLREWNARHAGEEPEGLGELDPSAPFADAVAASLPLKRVDAALREIIDALIASNLEQRLG